MKNDNTRADVMIALMRARDKISDLQAIYSTLSKLADDYNAWAGNDNLTLNNKQCILALNDLAILTDIANGDVLADIDAMAGGYDHDDDEDDEEEEDDEDGWEEDWEKDDDEEESESVWNNVARWFMDGLPEEAQLNVARRFIGLDCDEEEDEDESEETRRFLDLLEKFDKSRRE